MSVRKHLIHVKSNQLMTGSTTEPKAPESEVISYGEIAINYLKDKERMFIKNSDDEIVPFYSGKVIDDNEAVTAQALSELNSRINDIEESGEVVSQALGVLNNKVEQINAEKDDFNNMESVTYSELKSKRDDGELVPGKHYRITDYVTTTAQENTQSAGHQFDVVVLALGESTLSENAHAMLHDGDTYFSTNNAYLSTWELKYCLDNDTDRFAWADSVNGKGVIYYMKDEWNNECPYDFKNIQFKRKLSNGALDTTNGDDTFVYTFNLWRVNTQDIEDASIIGNTLKNDENHITGVYSNKINPVSEYNVHSEQTSFEVTQYLLNDNVFLNSDDYDGLFYGCYDNILGYDCFSNTFGNRCHNNTFGNRCHNNTFGNGCESNTFGDQCYDNSFGNFVNYNTFGYACHLNTFGESCSSNTFGDGCESNTFGNRCHNNTFGDECDNNLFGNHCGLNTFGKAVEYNTFVNQCYYNSFGNAVNHVTFNKNYTYYVIVENGNRYITLTSTETTTSSNWLRNITIAQGVNNINTNKTISHNSVNDTFKTTYQPANSVVVNL